MRSSGHAPRQLFGLTLMLVGLLSWHILPIPHPELAVRAANRAKVTEPTGLPVLRAVANGRVAFVSSEGNAHSDIYTMNPDGSDRKQLTFSQEESESEPVWSPDGTKIAFAKVIWTGNSGYREIFVMNADGSDQRRLTQSKFDQSPTWSPDGTKLAFWRIDSITMPMPSSWGIFVMNADGSDQRAIASTSGCQEPAWSPDGLKFAVGANYFGIYLINVDGSNQTQITKPPTSSDSSEDHDPAWSPDGSKITFIRCADANGFGCWDTTSHLWVVNADGSNPTKLTDTQAWSHAWSPDGRKIIFGNAQNSGGDLLVMNPDGSGLTNITNTDGKHEQSPSWQALPLTLPNPIDDPQIFVRQHYLDFLSREPEPSGLQAWLNVLNNCPAGDNACLHEQRLTTSAAFFGSPEFQLKGYFAFRFYRTAFDRLPEYSEISVDMQSVTGLTPAEVYARKATFTDAFSQRSEVVTRLGALSHTDYVAALLSRYGLSAITTPDPAQPDGSVKVTFTQAELVSRLESGTLTRAQVLRAIADSEQIFAAEFNPAFVAMQYYGYLRRTPESTGYNSWLNYLNAHPGDFREMVRGFVDSIEYRSRFAQS